MHGACKALRRFEFAFDERLVDHHLGGDVSQLVLLPKLHLLLHGFEVPLHPGDTHRNAVDQRERLRVFSEHRRKHTWDDILSSWVWA